MKEKSLYQILQVVKDVSPTNLKRQYKHLASKHHPDRTGGNPELMAEINAAYDVLKDPRKRAEYDRTGKVHIGPDAADEAANLINQRIIALMEQHNFTPKNYFNILKVEVTNNENSATRHQSKLVEDLAKLTYLIDHIKGDESLLAGLGLKRDAIETTIEQLERSFPIFKKVNELLEVCEYTGICPEVRPQWDTSVTSPIGGMNFGS